MHKTRLYEIRLHQMSSVTQLRMYMYKMGTCIIGVRSHSFLGISNNLKNAKQTIKQ